MTIPSYTEYKKDEFLRILIGHIQSNLTLDINTLATSFLLYDNIPFYNLNEIVDTIKNSHEIDSKVKEVITEINKIKKEKGTAPITDINTNSRGSYKKTYHNNPSLKNAPDAYDLATY
jgi:hypothetical protein